MAKGGMFEGVFPILVTPFDEQGGVDVGSFERIVRFMTDLGVDGVTILGVLGESNRLLDSEREVLIRAAVDAAEGRMAVVVGTSYSGTQATLGLSRMAEDLGADGVMVTPSREPSPNEERVFEFFARVAGGIGLPIVMQDHPGSTQVHMSVGLVLRLVAEIERVACIKQEALPSPARITALLQGMKSRSVPILTGLGALYGLFELERGSHGFMTGFAFPEVLMAMVRAAREDRMDRVRALYARFLPLIVFEQQPGVAIRKEIYRLRGMIAGSHVRHPGAGVDATTAAQLRLLLDAILPGVDLTRPLDV